MGLVNRLQSGCDAPLRTLPSLREREFLCRTNAFRTWGNSITERRWMNRATFVVTNKNVHTIWAMRRRTSGSSAHAIERKREMRLEQGNETLRRISVRMGLGLFQWPAEVDQPSFRLGATSSRRLRMVVCYQGLAIRSGQWGPCNGRSIRRCNGSMKRCHSVWSTCRNSDY